MDQIDIMLGKVQNQRPDIIVSNKLNTIAVDLTPVLPGGHNGGAKVFVLELIRHLSSLAPETKFVLLTNGNSHGELATLDAANVSRHKVLEATSENTSDNKLKLRKLLSEIVPFRFRAKLKKLFGRSYKIQIGKNLLRSLNADLLFCPFTAPTYHTYGIPTVCTLYDVQYKTYPQFFEPLDVLQRDHTFKDTCRHATAIAAISYYSRDSAIKHGDILPDQIRTIYLRMAHRISSSLDSATSNVLDTLGLVSKQYLLYPANFWQHKNHEMLLTAFSLARTQGVPESIKLVLTGAPGERSEFLSKAAVGMGLANQVVFPGYLSDDELSSLLHNSFGMIFPSLYEGFGLPVIEAMAADIPVACSNVTSLPEVVAGAALQFDPRIPEQIAFAIRSLVVDNELRAGYVNAGRKRAKDFADSARMAWEYLDLFDYAYKNMVRSDDIHGVSSDGWAGDSLHVTISPEANCKEVELELTAPEWLPHNRMLIQCILPNGQLSEHTMERGTSEVVRCPACSDADVQITISPTFVPSEHLDVSDNRQLSILVKSCALVLKSGARKSLYSEEQK